MKIAVVDPASYTFPYDYYWLKAQTDAEIDFYCSNSQYSNEYIQYLEKLPNVKVHVYNISQKNKFLGTINYIKMLLKILKNESKYEYIHFQWSIFFLLELPLFSLLSRKLVFTFHNSTPHKHAPNPYLPFLIIYKLCQKAIFVSSHTRNRFAEMYNIKNKHKLVLDQHPNIPVSPKYEIQEANQHSPLERTFIFWGNVKGYKGVDFFLDLAQAPEFREWKIEIHGKWDSELLSLKEKFSRFPSVHIQDHFLNEAEVYQILQRNALFVLPYKDGSQSGVVYTLKYYNKKFLCTPVGDQSSMDIKYLFTRSDLKDFKNKVQGLMR